MMFLLFVKILTEFLSSIPEFCNETQTSNYIEHDSSALMKSKLLKNSLRKKAFGKKATPEDRKALKQALKAYNYIKRLETKNKNKTKKQKQKNTKTTTTTTTTKNNQNKTKKQAKSVQHQEKRYHNNFWKFAGQCARGTLDQDIIKATFNADHANTYYPNKYGSANPVALGRLKWFPFLSTTIEPIQYGCCPASWH